jgi:acyl dehydratase
MHVSSRHVLRQGPMLATLGRTAARALGQRIRSGKSSTLVTPGAELTRTFAPLSSDLLDQYVKHIGGDPRAYRGLVPPHFFPHWALPVAAETLRGVPYPILRVLNAGCRMQVRSLMKRDEALHVRAYLASVEDDGKRAILTQRVVTGTDSAPDALITDLYAFVPLTSDRTSDRTSERASVRASDRERSSNGVGKREKPRVPMGAHEIASFHLPEDAGLSFAKLTGDFNPIHWVPAYAKASGFRNVILHGFATLARCCEALNRGLFAGDVRKLKLLDAKFTRPLVLPHDVAVYVRNREVFVGDGIEGPAYLSGCFETGDDR